MCGERVWRVAPAAGLGWVLVEPPPGGVLSLQQRRAALALNWRVEGRCATCAPVAHSHSRATCAEQPAHSVALSPRARGAPHGAAVARRGLEANYEQLACVVKMDFPGERSCMDGRPLSVVGSPERRARACTRRI